MNMCPNAYYYYDGIEECPYALTVSEDLPCCGTEQQCAEWRRRVKESKKELPRCTCEWWMIEHGEISHPTKTKDDPNCVVCHKVR